MQCNIYNIYRSHSVQALYSRLEGQIPVFITPQEQGGPVIPPGNEFPFCRLLRIARTTVEVF
jgi:hypothetical protein